MTQSTLSDTNIAISTETQKGVEGGTLDPADRDKNLLASAENVAPIVIAEQMPQFLGGEKELMDYLSKNLKYPVISIENNKQGVVVLRFVIDKEGNVTDINVVRSLDAHCDKEAVRVVKSMPRWTPGRQNGVAVAVYLTLPVRFNLNS